MTPERCLVERLGAAVAGVHELLDQLAAADALITDLVAENEQLRRRLAVDAK